MTTAAACALFTAWCELLASAQAGPVTSWPHVLDAVESELTRESVLLALPPAARGYVEFSAEIARCEHCRCRLLSQDERFSRLCSDCGNEFLMDVEHEAVDEW